MHMPQSNLQSEFYNLFQNDPTIFKWISENTVNGIWYGSTEDVENLWISESFWKTLGYKNDEKSSFQELEEILGDKEAMNSFNLLRQST